MEKQPEFKKNLWGYDKEAVLKYIDEMSRTAAQSEAALQEKVSQIAHSREELEGQIAEFEQKLQHISGVLDTEKGKNKRGWWKAAWYAGMFIVNLLAAFMLMILLCAGVGALIEKAAAGSLIDVGPALVLGFMLWMAAFGVFFLAMLPQIQIIILKILESRQFGDDS